MDKIKAFGEDNVECLRIRAEALTKPEFTPNHAKWNGAIKAIKEGNFTIAGLKEIYNISNEDSIRFNTNERKLMDKGEKSDLMESYDHEISGDTGAFAVAKLSSKINMEMQERFNRTAGVKKTYNRSLNSSRG